ncbi:MAG: DoxX family protein [Caldilineaceae bacterium]
MQSNIYTSAQTPTARANTLIWTGRVLTTLGVLFLVFDAVIKVMQIQPVVDTFNLLGIPTGLAPAIGFLMLALLAVYLFGRTSLLGAILLTGYLGGAIALQLRIGAPAFNLVFPLIVAAFIWGGLYLRDPLLRTVLPMRR